MTLAECLEKFNNYFVKHVLFIAGQLVLNHTPTHWGISGATGSIWSQCRHTSVRLGVGTQIDNNSSGPVGSKYNFHRSV